MDLGEYSNNKIQQVVLPQIESSYRDKLLIFDKFIKLYLYIIILPDIRIYRAFLEWVIRVIYGRVEERPIAETI
ncbi:Zinc finger C2H2 [Penicillium cf. viridicatum]|uniref:Zinc finger C2H2 n=1 Tax=Penicillium cf. viridicatum TaxID=2972119 RepID=A0A9W9JBK8_9EURO|nr:Zinc finger C2H2 [Penicillium cf. viridicatum]